MNARGCTEIRADLSAYLEGDLDAGQAEAIRAHLEGCAGCRSELALLRLTIGALQRLPDLPPPAAILSGVRARLHPEPWYRRVMAGARWPLAVPLGAAATLLVAIGVSLFATHFPELSKTVSNAPAVRAPVESRLQVQQEAPRPASELSRRREQEQQAAPLARDERFKGKTAAQATPNRAPPSASPPPPAAPPALVSTPTPTPTPTPAPAPAPAPAPVVVTPRLAALPAPVGRAAVLDSDVQATKAEQPSPRTEAAAFASKDALKETAEEATNRASFAGTAPPAPAAAGGSIAGLDKKADARADLGYARPAEAKAKRAAPPRVVCLLAPEVITLEGFQSLIARSGATVTTVTALAADDLSAAFAPQRGRPGAPREPARGWEVNASVPTGQLPGLLETLARTPGVRILEQPAAKATSADAASPSDLRITILR